MLGILVFAKVFFSIHETIFAMVKRAAEANKKQKKDSESEEKWIPWGKGRNPQHGLTKEEIETVICKAFNFPTFPGWKSNDKGTHLYVHGPWPGHKAVGLFVNYFPTTGRVCFQGKFEEKESAEEVWDKTLKEYLKNLD